MVKESKVSNWRRDGAGEVTRYLVPYRWTITFDLLTEEKVGIKGLGFISLRCRTSLLINGVMPSRQVLCSCGI